MAEETTLGGSAGSELNYNYPVYMSREQAESLRDYLTQQLEAGTVYIPMLTPAPVGAVMNALGLGIRPGPAHQFFIGHPGFSLPLDDPGPNPIPPDPFGKTTPPVHPGGG